MENNHSSSNSSGSGVSVGDRLCHCGASVKLYTAYTKLNNGRRFLRCGGVQGQKCDFFEWVDPYMCAQAHSINPGLLVRVNHLDDENRRMETVIVPWRQK
ncbi:hypothetical protein ACJIZ3_022175 [Penstemon smallii]|uniref:GRF-type domain-containing protein n=1 Tax=Penstemon smallii TaxID=265156 RepID=A0ABD3SNI1_9LAMI